jgi:hypothetical protein
MFQFESPETGLTASFPVAAGKGKGFVPSIPLASWVSTHSAMRACMERALS